MSKKAAAEAAARTLHLSPKDAAAYVKSTVTPTAQGQPVREVAHPLLAWGVGALPFPPTPAERHIPMEIHSNPSAIDRLTKAFKALGIRPKNPIMLGLLAGAGGGAAGHAAAEMIHGKNPELLATHSGESPLSKTFHGTSGEVDTVRQGGRTKKVIDMGALKEVKTDKAGNVENIVYEPDSHSERGHIEWDHRSGDRGLPFGVGNSSKKPKLLKKPGRGDRLVVDPATRRPEIAGSGELSMGGSPMRFSSTRGLVG